jgi:hypothetical protein
MKVRKTASNIRIAAMLAMCLACCCTLTGCLVAGYSSGGGFWVWPGSIVITLMLLALWFFTRR